MFKSLVEKLSVSCSKFVGSIVDDKMMIKELKEENFNLKTNLSNLNNSYVALKTRNADYGRFLDRFYEITSREKGPVKSNQLNALRKDVGVYLGIEDFPEEGEKKAPSK